MSERKEPATINFSEFDEFVRKADEIGRRSHSERNEFLLSRHLAYDIHLNGGPAAEPFSPEFTQRVEAQWKLVAGRETYEVALEHDPNIVADENQLRHLYPFISRDTRFIAEYWIGVYAALKLLVDAPNRSIVEYGVGWGNATVAILQAGYEVLAVDIDKKWLSLLELRAEQLLVRPALKTHVGEFGDLPEDGTKYGAFVFYECFHHALQHDDVLGRIAARLVNGGLIVFAAEAIYPGFPVEWGVRQDGHSLWAIRRFGWMELGFGEDYFIRLTRRHNLTLSKQVCPEAGAFGVAYVARREPMGMAVGHTLLTSSETGFHAPESDRKVATRFTDGNAILEIPSGSLTFTIELKNWLTVQLKCQLVVADLVLWSGVIGPGDQKQLTLANSANSYYTSIKICSDSHVPKSLGINDDTRNLGVAVGYLTLNKKGSAPHTFLN